MRSKNKLKVRLSSDAILKFVEWSKFCFDMKQQNPKVGVRMFVDLLYDSFYKYDYEYTEFIVFFRTEFKDIFSEEEMSYTYAD